MSELPEKFLQLAADVMPEGASFQETCTVARAILAAVEDEREACAQLAIEYNQPGYTEFVDGYNVACEQISAAIRNRSVTDKG